MPTHLCESIQRAAGETLHWQLYQISPAKFVTGTTISLSWRGDSISIGAHKQATHTSDSWLTCAVETKLASNEVSIIV